MNLSIYQYLQQCVYTWYYINCFEDIIPFSNKSDDDLYKTNVGKKNKIEGPNSKTKFQNQEIIEELNNAMDNPQTEILSIKYFEPNELAPLLKNKESLSFFHLNIYSFPFHFHFLLIYLG